MAPGKKKGRGQEEDARRPMRLRAQTAYEACVGLWALACIGLVGGIAGAVWGLRATLDAVLDQVPTGEN